MLARRVAGASRGAIRQAPATLERPGARHRKEHFPCKLKVSRYGGGSQPTAEEITLAVALVAVAVTLALVGPVLLVISAMEWKRRSRRLLGLALAGVLLRAVVWLWLELGGAPHGRWHPCAQCRTRPSRSRRARGTTRRCVAAMRGWSGQRVPSTLG